MPDRYDRASAGHLARTDDAETTTAIGSQSRRGFLQTAAAGAGVGALSLGLGGTASAQTTRVEEECGGGSIAVGEHARILDNQWSNPDAEQCVFLNDDGSYGWEFDATGTGGDGLHINYPQALIGTKPFGDDTGAPDFPIRRSEIDELSVDIEAEIDISGNRWDFGLEWWLTEESTAGGRAVDPAVEVMVLPDWGSGYGHGEPEVAGVATDQFGNAFDLWITFEDGGGTDAPFYQFRIDGRHDGGPIDLVPLLEWLRENRDPVTDDLWFTGLELGNEYWGGAVGSATIDTFDATINGATYATGSESDEQPTCGDREVSGTASVDGRTVCDVDGDGLHRDVTGDGSVGQTDVVQFFERQHRSAWKRPELFDFSGNGAVGHGDVVSLFEHVARQP